MDTAMPLAANRCMGLSHLTHDMEEVRSAVRETQGLLSVCPLSLRSHEKVGASVLTLNCMHTLLGLVLLCCILAKGILKMWCIFSLVRQCLQVQFENWSVDFLCSQLEWRYVKFLLRMPHERVGVGRFVARLWSVHC